MTAATHFKSQRALTSNHASSAKQTLLAMAVLLGAALIVALLVLVFIALRLNDRAETQSRFLVDKAWQMREAGLKSSLKDNAFWGDAYEHLHVKVDPEWAYVSRNLGPSLYDDFQIEGVFVVNGNNETPYAVINGQLEKVELKNWLGGDVGALIERARKLADDSGIAIESRQVGGRPALVAAAALTTGSDPKIATIPGTSSVLVFVDVLTPPKLEHLGESYAVHNLRTADENIDDSSPSTLRLVSADDRPSILQWDPDLPGEQLFKLLLPLLVVVIIILGFIARLVMRRAMTSARLIDEHILMINESSAALKMSEERFRNVAEAASDWVWEVDSDLRISYLSERFQVITGYDVASWLGRSLEELMIGEMQPLAEWLRRADQAGARRELRCCYHSAQGRRRTCCISVKPIVQRSETVGYRGTASDITHEIEAQARIHHLSQHDALTGLPNRVQMQEFLAGKLKALPSSSNPLVMLSLDLDRFKPVNDTFGHIAGDQVLNEVSERLRKCLREEDLIARQGGDEFIIIVTGTSSAQEIESLCGRLIESVEFPFVVNEQDVYIGVSIGIAIAPHDAVQAEELLRFADIALYQAKNGGRNTWMFYASEMDERLVKRREMEKSFRLALKNEELRLHYQPRYRIEGTQLSGVEALVRWEHPVLGVQMPDQFIALAEETGLIIPMSDWVLLQACKDAVKWQMPLTVSVNISPVEFRTQNLVERITLVLAAAGLPSSRLELEVTERVMIEDAHSALKIMTDLKALGVRLSMDDFGTGYSSLSYLRSFPFDGLKIDKSFIEDLTESTEGQSIVNAIVGLGRALSLTITAEGVETAAQLEQLRTFACDEAQGYFLGKPMLLESLVQLIDDSLSQKV